MFKINENGLKLNVWIDERTIINSSNFQKILAEESAGLYAETKRITVELFIPRAHNNYALLGIDFIANKENKVTVKSSLSNLNNEKYNESIALPFDNVICGITKEFEDGIILSVNKHTKMKALPSGILIYSVSAYGEIGSSACMFQNASDILLSLLLCANMNESSILRIIKDII